MGRSCGPSRKTALILYVVASVLLALIMLFVDPSNIQMAIRISITTMIATVIASVSGIMLLIYMIQAQRRAERLAP